MHSPWGLIYRFVKETGWSWNDILWKVNRANLMLMMADQPNFKRTGEKAVPDTGQGLASRFKKRYEK